MNVIKRTILDINIETKAQNYQKLVNFEDKVRFFGLEVLRNRKESIELGTRFTSFLRKTRQLSNA